MIASAVFCPQAPVLVPELAGSAAVELDELRAAAREAIRRAVPPGVRPVLIGGADAPGVFDSSARGTLAGFGLPLEVTLGRPDGDGPPSLPPSLTVGAWLVRDALGPDCGAVAVAVTDGRNDIPQLEDGDVALVVLGDGSARRAEKSPGYLDERAVGFDETISAALAAGDAAGLRRDALAVGNELLVSGLAAWDAVATALDRDVWDAELLYDDAPYGVGYFVALWTRRG